ncbi:MAG: amidohydrolase family protein [Gemmatimonadales bacterium]
MAISPIRTTIRFAAVALLAACAGHAGSKGVEPGTGYDLVIRNGRVLDGAGNPWVRADVGVKGGIITKVGVVRERGRKEIDAAGRYVSPGWIDMMDQSGQVLLENGAAENKLRMGVTSLIGGEGGTPVPAAEVGGYFARLEQQGIAVNFGSYYSAAQARVDAMGDGAGSPTPAQMARMKADVSLALEQGVFGVSSALIYPPESFQTTEDLIELARLGARCNGFYATHMRDESENLVSAIREAVEIGEKAGVKVEIFHLKAAYAPGWGRLMPQGLAEVEAARARGVDVAADMYPYEAGGTGLSITVPNWVFADGEVQGYQRLRDSTVRQRLKREVAAGSLPGWSNLVVASGGWDHVVLANPFNPKWEANRSRSIGQIAKQLGRDPADVAWDIVLDALPNRAMALFFMMDEGDIETALQQTWTSIGSDAAASVKFGEVDALGLPHPRAYGTFPRVIAEYVKKRHVLTLEQAVRKMTSWPAARMGLDDRGVIREGLRADLTIFDYDRLNDAATWEHPTAAPTGIDYVVVNGEVAIADGAYTGAKAGRVLHGGCWRSPVK